MSRATARAQLPVTPICAQLSKTHHLTPATMPTARLRTTGANTCKPLRVLPAAGRSCPLSSCTSGLYRYQAALGLGERRSKMLVGKLALRAHGPSRMDQALAQAGMMDLTLDPTDPLLDDKRQYMKKKLRLSEPVHLTIPPTEAMLGFLRLRELKGMDAFMLKPVFKDDVWEISKEPGSQENERAVCERMAKEAREAIARFGSPDAADVALLQGGTLKPGSWEETKVQIRVAKLQSLQATAEWFEQRAAGLSQLSYYQTRWLGHLGLGDNGATTSDEMLITRNETVDVDVGKQQHNIEHAGQSLKVLIDDTVKESKLMIREGTALYFARAAIVSVMAVAVAWLRASLVPGILTAISILRDLVQLYPQRRRNTALLSKHWIKLRQVWRLQGRPEWFFQDAASILQASSNMAGRERDLSCSGLRYSLNLTGILSLAILAGCLKFREVLAEFWMQGSWVSVAYLLAILWVQFLQEVVETVHAQEVVKALDERKEALKLRGGSWKANPGPVKVGFLDQSMTLPVYRYLFSQW